MRRKFNISSLLLCVSFGGVSFGRLEWFLGITGGMVSAAILGLLVIKEILFKKLNIKESISMAWLGWAYVSSISILLSVVLLRLDPSQAFVFFIEIFFCTILVFSGFFAARNSDSIFDLFYYFTPWIFVGLYLQYANFQIGFVIRRLMGELTAANYAAFIYGIFALFFFHLLISNRFRDLYKRVFVFLMFLMSFISLAAIGTRSVLFPLVFLIFSRFFFIRSKVLKYSAALLLMASFATALSHFDLAAAIDRFNLSEILRALNVRLSLISSSIQSVDGVLDVLLGRPNLYYIFYEDGSGWLHPHNIFISNYSFLGGGASLFMVYILFLYARKFWVVWKKNMVTSEFLFIFDLCVIALIYSSLSGNFTRIWGVYFIFGLAAGVLYRFPRGRYVTYT